MLAGPDGEPVGGCNVGATNGAAAATPRSTPGSCARRTGSRSSCTRAARSHPSARCGTRARARGTGNGRTRSGPVSAHTGHRDADCSGRDGTRGACRSACRSARSGTGARSGRPRARG